MAARTAAAARRSTWRSFCPSSLRLSAGSSRLCSSKQATQKDKPVNRSTYRPEPSSTHDWVGPPNPLSSLRPIIYHIPENETELEKRLRNLRQDTEDWNHNFWAKQNITFSKEKEAFIISQLKAKGLTLRDQDGRRRSLSSEEMATFYKNFLDKNRVRHANYNKEWYRRNFTITLLLARVTLNSMWRTVTERQSSKKNGTPTS
ncbi:cytochrome c oxidase assembly factor 8 isoform X1 [Pelmatolapia mariae]|uniref:cytochrome c oxidase assembly factor 8 isoform X1 n=1 Tax=Pelmatolapia mariae TaxID=158779 RepID=UPI002FE605DF